MIFLFVKWRVSKQEALNKKLEELVKKRTEELNEEIIKKEKAQTELKNYAEELEKVNTTKDRVISILSHDLRNPVNSISSIAEFLYNNRNELTHEELDDLLIQIRNSSLTLNSLVENLLEWSRIQTNRINYILQNFNLSESIKNSILLLESFAKQKYINIICNCTDRIEVIADKTSTESILINLLSNAIKFSYSKSDIKISAILKDNFVEVSIKDYGIGISREDLENIFSHQMKFTKAGTMGEKGTGLGLTLVKEHIEKNGGKFWIESEPEKGTTVYFTLPLAKSL